MKGENVTGYRFGISYTCSALRYKLAFIVESGYRLGISYTSTTLRYKPAFIATCFYSEC